MSSRWRRQREPSGSASLPAITDSFNRADNASSLGTADTGQAWVVVAGLGIWGINGNQAYNPTAAVPGAVIDRGSPNMTVQCTMAKWVTSTGNSGLIWRVIDQNNYWWSQKVGGQLWIRKVVATVDTVVQQITVGMADNDVHAVSVDGNNLITVKLNGSTIYTVTDAANASGTKGGLGGNPVVADRYENFSLTSP